MRLAARNSGRHAGRIEQNGALEDIFHRQTSAFFAGFIVAVNALDVSRAADGALTAIGLDAGPGVRMRVQFRSDSARLAPTSIASAQAFGDLVLTGIVAQSVYIGQGFRYRVHTDDADIWVHASERVEEGTQASVVVPHDALLLFPVNQPRSQ